jgi:aryl-alcohol dehydrogenase-like predicted oxidoreductase
MQTTRLGRTNLNVTRTSFGVLPIQRVDFDTARAILRRAYELGINFYDTASGYSDSEEKIGYSLSDVRGDIIIATKCSGAKNRGEVIAKVEQSLSRMKTDYVDVLQLHNPNVLPDPNDPESTYAGLLEAQRRGMTRFIGITNHSRETALEAVKTGLFDTLQFPLSAISAPEDFELAETCASLDVGFIAMKALCGGLLTNARIAFAGLRPYTNVVPIWGIQRIEELQELVALEQNPPELSAEVRAEIAAERQALAGEFCRACGYCLPCPEDIPIPMAARMGLLIDRMPSEKFRSSEWREKMALVENCTECRACVSRCPYDLDTPALLKKNLEIYRRWIAAA